MLPLVTETSLKVFLDFKSIARRYSVLLLRNYITVAELNITQFIIIIFKFASWKS